MRALRLSNLIVLGLLAAPSALADTATDDGAKQLRDGVSTFLGHSAFDQGVVRIEPAGEAYRATIDFQRLADLVKRSDGGNIAIRPWTLLLTPIDNGDWKCVTDDFPTIDLDIPTDADRFTLSVRVNGFHFEGEFSPKLAVFISSVMRSDSLDMKAHIPGPATGARDIEYHLGASVSEGKAVEAGDGAVIATLKQTQDGMKETVVVTPPGDGGAPSRASVINLGPSVSDGTTEGLRSVALRDLWTFLIATVDSPVAPDPAKLQSDLKPKILAVLPLWNNIGVTLTTSDMSMDMNGVMFDAKTFSETLALSGLVARGSVGARLKADGVRIAGPALPAWMAPLMPTAFDIDAKVADSGIDQIARLVIDEFKPGAKPPVSSETDAKIAAIAKAGDPRLTFGPSWLTAQDIELTFQGELALTTPPTGKWSIAVDGFDKLLAAFKAGWASDAQTQQALIGAAFVKGLAKQGPGGKLSWDVELGPGGAVSINGLAMPLSHK
jgi:hypothetical protein